MRIRALLAILATALATSTASATFHFMQVEQVIGGVNGNTGVQAIQLRMRSAGQNLVSNARVRAWDAAGGNPILIVDMTTNVANGAAGARVLIATNNLPAFTTTGLTPDFVMSNPIPASYMPAGSLTFEDNIGTVYWRVSWGGAAYTGPGAVNVTNDADGNANPPFPGQLPRCTQQALQFRFAAAAASTNNANDYQITLGSAVLVRNNGQTGTVTGPPAPTGACCTGAACGSTSACGCGVSGGSYQGDGTVCSPNPCVTPEACCYADGSCLNLLAADCAATGGESQGAGSACQGDLDGNGIDETCQGTPCSDSGPGPHWVDAAHAGIDTIPTGALVGIDTTFDCVRDTNLVMFGPAGVRRTGAVDDSTNFPGTRPVDGHLDVIDTEMVAMTLTGGGATLIAGAGRGSIPLGPTPGNIAEQPGNNSLADSFFDVFFEIDLGGGNRVYNWSPLPVQSVIDCIPPSGIYYHPIGICIPLYTSPIPGSGSHVANLVSANHDPFPQPGACCLPGGGCIDTVGSSRVDLQACKLEYSIVSPK